MNKNKWFLNGGRGSGRTIRLLCETYENRIADLEDKLANADFQLKGRDNEIAELEQENKVLAQNLEDTDIVNKALEKENAELRAKESFVGDQNRKLCDQQQKIEVLEAENAELKAKNKWYSEQVCNKECAEVWGELTKAKEIIREFVEWATWQGSNCPNFKSIQDKAEQFLSEVEK